MVMMLHPTPSTDTIACACWVGYAGDLRKSTRLRRWSELEFPAINGRMNSGFFCRGRSTSVPKAVSPFRIFTKHLTTKYLLCSTSPPREARTLRSKHHGIFNSRHTTSPHPAHPLHPQKRQKLAQPPPPLPAHNHDHHLILGLQSRPLESIRRARRPAPHRRQHQDARAAAESRKGRRAAATDPRDQGQARGEGGESAVRGDGGADASEEGGEGEEEGEEKYVD